MSVAVVQAAVPDVPELMHALGRKAVTAAEVLALAPSTVKNAALAFAAAALRAQRAVILAANERDVAAARSLGMSAALLDRLTLDDARIDEAKITGMTPPVFTLSGMCVLDPPYIRRPTGASGRIISGR